MSRKRGDYVLLLIQKNKTLAYRPFEFKVVIVALGSAPFEDAQIELMK